MSICRELAHIRDSDLNALMYIHDTVNRFIAEHAGEIMEVSDYYEVEEDQVIEDMLTAGFKHEYEVMSRAKAFDREHPDKEEVH